MGSLTVGSYELTVDLTDRADTFTSRAAIRFRDEPPSSSVALDAEAVRIRRVILNGDALDVAEVVGENGVAISPVIGDNVVVVEGVFGYASAGAGLHRVAGDDRPVCVYSKGFPDGARRMYGCFDRNDLRAPFRVRIRAPAGWSCLSNGAVVSAPADGTAGVWAFATTPPLAPYVSSFCAGRWSSSTIDCARSDGEKIAVTVNTVSPAMSPDGVIAPEFFGRLLRCLERDLGAAYPWGKCDFVFVPDFPGLAFGAPGLITVKDTVLRGSRNSASALILATVVAHELAHSWIGGLVDWPLDDGWLVEALTTYIGRTVLEETCDGASPWAPAVSELLPDDAYAEDAAIIKRLEELIGRAALLDGLGGLIHEHAYRCLTKDDLVVSWSRAAGRDLAGWAKQALVSARTDSGTS